MQRIMADEVETVRIDEEEDGSWILTVEGVTLAFAVKLSAAVCEELDNQLVGYREWRADRHAARSEYNRHILSGLCPVWVVGDGTGESGPCVREIEHDGEHRSASGAVA